MHSTVRLKFLMVPSMDGLSVPNFILCDSGTYKNVNSTISAGKLTVGETACLPVCRKCPSLMLSEYRP